MLPITEEGQQSPNYPVRIQTFNSSGNPVEMVFFQKPERVVTDELNPLETLIALGQGDRIVGASVEKGSEAYKKLIQKYPGEMEKVRGIYEHELDMENVIATQPDFILGWKGTFSAKRYRPTEWWNQRGVNTYIVATANHILENGTIEDECHFLNDIGRIFDVTEKTDSIIAGIHAEINHVKNETKDQPSQKTMVIELMGRSIMNYDRGWIVGDMVEQLGGVMPVTDSRIGYEDLIQEDPDVIFVNYFNDGQKTNIKHFFENPMFSSIKAVKNHRIYLFPFDCLYTPGIKTIDGIRIIRDGLYPELMGT